MIGAALLAATAAAGSPYPVQDILTAFGDVCFDPASDSAKNGYERTPSQRAEAWKALALAKGWEEVGALPSPGQTSDSNAIARTYYWSRALDYELFVPLESTGTGRITVQVLLKKTVAGRQVFLSILGTETDNPTLAECRLRDPLGDGITKQPVAKADVERWLGKTTKRSAGRFGGSQYTWPASPYHALQVHFGFKDKPFGISGVKYDPYALYGLTLVRSDYDEIIVT